MIATKTDEQLKVLLRDEVTKLFLAATKFEHQGRGDGVLDCFGLLLHLYELAGIPLADEVAPEQDRTGAVDVEDFAIAAYSEEFVEIHERATRPLDVFLVPMYGNIPNHVAVATGDWNVVHMSEQYGLHCIEAEAFRRCGGCRVYRHRSRLTG